MWSDKLSWVIGAAGLVGSAIAGCGGASESVPAEEPAAQKPAEQTDRMELQTDLFRERDVRIIESNLPPDYEEEQRQSP